MLKIVGIVLVCDGVFSCAWYKSDLLSVLERRKQRGASVRTGLRLLRALLGICLILAG